MFELIDNILQKFRKCFNRESTFLWFCVVVFGMMIRSDFRGITSIVGALTLKPKSYYNMLHFFHSEGYSIENIKKCWTEIVLDKTEIKEISGYSLAIGDHSKVVKEGKHMPAVKKHHQDSENSGKGEYIYGHEFGMIGLITSGLKMQCLPVDIEIHDGKEEIDDLRVNNSLTKSDSVSENLVKVDLEKVLDGELKSKSKKKYGKNKKTKTKKKPKKRKNKVEEKSKSKKIGNKSSSAKKLMEMFDNLVNRVKRPMLILLDAGFATGDVFRKVYEINKKAGKNLAAVITRAKINYVGCEEAEETTEKRVGRRPKYGTEHKLYDFFHDIKQFKTVNLCIYGKLEQVQYFCINLIWKSSDSMIRFVMVKTGEKRMILMSSDIMLSPGDIITAYTYRFKIEVTFKELKHSLGCFCYHFWTGVMPKLSKFKTKTDLSGITERLDISKIMATVKAIEIFTFIGCISFGILSIVANKFPNIVWKHFSGWLKTKTSEIPSIEITRVSIQKIYILNKLKLTKYATFKIINDFQDHESYEYDDYCA